MVYPKFQSLNCVPELPRNFRDWKKSWGGHLVFPSRHCTPQIPASAHAFLSSHGFPKLVEFKGSVEFVISFAPLARKLKPFNATFKWGDFYDKVLDRAWAEQMQIAVEKFDNGTASFCVHAKTGAVSRIDVELSDPEEYVNDSVQQFGMSLLLFKKWADAVKNCDDLAWQPMLSVLKDNLESLDKKTRTKGYWRSLFDAVKDSGPASVIIS